MALGLFSTLIIGLIIKQISLSLSGNISLFLLTISSVATFLTGPVIGIGVSNALNSPKLVILASAVTGFIASFASAFSSGKLLSQNGQLMISGPGDPLGAFICVVIASEIGSFISGKSKLDIIITPFMTIISGSIIAFLIGPHLFNAMQALGNFIKVSTELQPFFMGIVVSVFMGIILTLPISSAAISIILGLSGIAAGASTVGCSCQMIGFAVISFKVNGWNGLLAQGIGTSMLQISNIMKKPIICIPPIVASAILGPLASLVFKMKNNPAGAGMGTSGFVGQLMTWQTMSPTMDKTKLFIEILLLHFILPAIISLLVAKIMKAKSWIKDEDYKLDF